MTRARRVRAIEPNERKTAQPPNSGARERGQIGAGRVSSGLSDQCRRDGRGERRDGICADQPGRAGGIIVRAEATRDPTRRDAAANEPDRQRRGAGRNFGREPSAGDCWLAAALRGRGCAETHQEQR